jgi:hypothetical protein
MKWEVILHPGFDGEEFLGLPEDVQDELLARLQVVATFGPTLGRPHVDTLKGSEFPNMKELRFQLDGIWRFAFAFDPKRRAVVLCGGDKEGDRRFYREMIKRRIGGSLLILRAWKKLGRDRP